ncbi:MAG: RHS repeat protein [Gammaproteobacteria bacterium]|nr:RHS repeat protein [Gammaproteobacteria bacterium]
MHSSDNASSRETTYSYDRVGNLKTTTDAKTRDTTETYDNLNRTLSILDTAQQLTQHSYDNRDNLTQVTNARDIAIRQYQYDKNNQILKELLPDGDSLLEQSYNPNGNLQQSIDAKGQVVNYSYDMDNRLDKVQYFSDLASAADPQNAQKSVDFSYDNLNRIKSWDDGNSSGSYDYDDAGQIITSSVNYGSFTLEHSYTYYPSGLKKTYTGPDNITYNKEDQDIQ